MAATPDRKLMQSRLVPCLISVLVVCATALFPVYNNDVFGHMAAGRQIVETGAVPDYDTFSFFRDRPQPWHNHNWLSCLVFYVAYQHGGANALLAVKLLTVAVTAVLVVLAAGTGSLPAWIAVGLTALWMPVVRMRLTVRPHLFGALALAFLAFAVPRLVAARSPRHAALWILGLALSQTLWTNLHGSGPLGWAITTAALLCWIHERPARIRLAALLAAQVVASCISPWGPFILLESFAHIGDSSMREVLSEWQSFADAGEFRYVAALLVEGMIVAVVALPAARGSAKDRYALVIAVVLLVMGVRSARFVISALWLSVPFVAPLLVGRFDGVRRTWRRSWRRAVAFGTAAGLTLWVPLASQALSPEFGFGFGSSTIRIPEGSGAWIERFAPRARVLGAIEDAWYVSFAAPHSRVLVDGRVALYGLDMLREVASAFTDADRFGRLLKKYRVDTVVIKRAYVGHREALAWLCRQPDWRLVTIEDFHAVFTRLPVGQTLTRLPVTPVIQRLPERTATLAELRPLRKARSARGYVAYIDALLTLDSWLRTGGADGLSTEQETGLAPASRRAAMARALRLLRDADEALAHIPSVSALHGLVAIQTCDLDEAEAAFDSAAEEAQNRHTILGRAELAIRRGNIEQARAVLTHARQDPRSQGDHWQTALWRDIEHPRHDCPSSPDH